MNNKRTIPEIRARMYVLADELNLPELAQLADETYRRPAKRRAPVQSEKLTPALAATIRTFADQNPHMTQHQIGMHFNVNPGRVSEALDRQL